MYTEKFLNSQSKMQKLEITFANNPCKETATPLAQSRADLEKFSYNDKFTLEFRTEEQMYHMNAIAEILGRKIIF